MVLNALREGEAETALPAVRVPHRQVIPLHERRREIPVIGRAEDGLLPDEVGIPRRLVLVIGRRAIAVPPPRLPRLSGARWGGRRSTSTNSTGTRVSSMRPRKKPRPTTSV